MIDLGALAVMFLVLGCLLMLAGALLRLYASGR